MNLAFNFSFTFSLSFLWFSLAALSDNSLIINEINYSVKNSDGVEDQGQEWIEIYNTTDQSDSPMTKVDRSTYAGFSNKLSKGTPNQYWVERFIDKVRIHIYPTPDSTNASKDMHFYFIKRIQDVGDYTNATDVPFRFVPCMVSGLAYYLSQKYQPQLIQATKLAYEDEFARALAEDGSASSTHITPKAYYPGT